MIKSSNKNSSNDKIYCELGCIFKKIPLELEIKLSLQY